jgi:hypothetical protein
VSDSLELFSLSAATEEEAWLHGQATARAWFTGVAEAQDGLDVVGEFDAKVSGQLSAEVARSLASVQAEGSAAAHAGLRLQVGIPLDLVRGAGLVARLRAEASANAQITVTAKLSAGELADLCLAKLPEEVRSYCEIVLEQATLSAGAWARGSFAAMASAELVTTIVLFPEDGSAPGVTAFLRYGYAWGWGGGWGTVVNVGLEPRQLVARLGAQAGADIRRVIDQTGDDGTLGDLERWLLRIVPSLVPAALNFVVRLALLSQEDDPGSGGLDGAVAELVGVLRDAAIAWLTDGLARLAGEQISQLDLDALGEAALRAAWDAIDAVTAARVDSPTAASAGLNAILESLGLAARLVHTLGSADAAALESLIRCAAALVLLEGAPASSEALDAVFPNRDPAASPITLAVDTLGAELATVLAHFTVVPDWLKQAFGSVGNLVTLITDWRSNDPDTDTQLVAQLLHSVLRILLTGPGWEQIEVALPPPVRPAVRGVIALLDDFCTDSSGDTAARAKRLREGASICVLALAGEPLADLITIVANDGLRAAPAAFRDLADLVDVGDYPPSLTWSWQQLAEAAVGVAAGLPTATVLRKTAATIENWCTMMLPEELRFLESSLRLGAVCERMVDDGPAKAIGDFKSAYLGSLAEHAAKHILYSLAFTHVEGLQLLEAILVSSVESIARSLEVVTIASFKVLDEAITLSEAAAVEVEKRVDDLERKIAEEAAKLARGLRDLSAAVADGVDQIADALTDAILDSALRIGSDRGVVRDVLKAIVETALAAATGGLSRTVEELARRTAQILDIGAEGLAAAAVSSSAPRGIRGLIESASSTGPAPKVRIPVTITLPNPLLPGVLPGITIELFSIEIPSAVVGQLAMTVMFDAIGAGPALDALDGTVGTLKGLRVALDQAKQAVGGATPAEQRAAFDASVPTGPLSIQFSAPEAGAATPGDGEVRFRVINANISFVDPAAAGLPAGTPRRVQVRVNGREVGDHVRWQAVLGGLEGRFAFSTSREAQDAVFVAAPACVVVTVTGGMEPAATASKMLFFVPRQDLPRALLVERIAHEQGRSGRIAMVGGTGPHGEWRINVGDAIRLLDDGRGIYVKHGDIQRRVRTARSRTGRRYLRTSGRGAGRLEDLPAFGP